MSIDLRKATKASPKSTVPAVSKNAAAAPLQLPVVANRLPLPVGVMSLTPEEQAALDAVGWKPGEHVVDMSEIIAKIKSDADSVPNYDPQLGVANRKDAAIVDINTLPPDKKAELARAYSEMQQQAKVLNEIEKMQIASPTAGDVNENIANVIAGTEKFQVTLGDTNKKTPVEDTSPTGFDLPKTPCINCGFAGSKLEDVTVVTEDDKEAFLSMLIGGSRFYKEFEIYNGAIKIVFRSLTQTELDMALTQASCDMAAGKIPDQAEYFRRVHNYEQCMAIHKIVSEKSAVTFPEISEVLVDEAVPGEPLRTKLVDYQPYVYEKFIKTSSMLRIVSTLYLRFNALMSRLEANMHNADFWKGIVPHV